ncbi:MAG: ATP-dependent metallopeptidase FtsH/Yme1/Tma family protein [Sulfurimonas sp.]|jgi:ATP-dependent metalloprotease FtsH|nr:ATP-dependent metallopeptidase FtsH/Yme1/Tma family protein [Sulfurimonadaceae bacterium]
MASFKTNRVLLYLSSIVIALLLLFVLLRDNADDITLNEAISILESKDIKNIVATDDYVYIKTAQSLYKIPSSQVNPQMFIDHKVKVKNSYNPLVYVLIFLLLVAIVTLFYRWWIKSKETQIAPKAEALDMQTSQILPMRSDITFNDVGGISDVKSELEEIIDFMRNPKKYKNFGARMPKGVLLVGPPGVGKTMIAKAMANEAGVPFYYQSGASFVQIYVGMGAKRVHELFSVAKAQSPSIIFIDEIDAVGKKRDGTRNDEREATLNQLLTEMDGFDSSSGVMVIAATNNIDVLDSALLRAGRFDRRIFVELPTKSERALILKTYLSRIPNSVDVDIISSMSVGFNGAALAALVNEATLLAIRNNEIKVIDEHFFAVKDKVMFGKKRLLVLSAKQKELLLTYQAAKALSATYYDIPFEKLMLSNEKLTPSTDEPLLKHELESRVKMLLSGMVACGIKHGEHASSAKNDLDEAKSLAQDMAQSYGMGSTLISQDEDEILLELKEQSREFLSTHLDTIEQIEQVLKERESVTKDEVLKLLNDLL